MHLPIISCENKHGFIQNALFFQLIPHSLAGSIHSSNESIVILQHFVVFLWVVEPVSVSISTFVALTE